MTEKQIYFKPRVKIIIFLFLFLAEFGQSQTTGQILEKAYKKKSNVLLKQFFQNWNKDIQPVTEIELSKLNDTFRQAYQVFTGFYKPQSIDSLGGSEWGKDIYKNVSFLIVQNYINIKFTDKVYFTQKDTDGFILDFINKNYKDSARQIMLKLKRINGKFPKIAYDILPYDYFYREDKLTDSIINFRPRINCSKKQPIFLTSKYNDILNAFLGNTHLPLGAGGIMNPARALGESEKRKKFLEKYIKIWYGHWGGYWQLYSYPYVSITFDQDMKYARVDFTMVYEGGEAILKNDNGNWIIISAKRTWIE